MSGLAFTVPGEARGKGRARIVKIAGFSRMAADEKTVAYEGTWAAIAHRAMAGRPPMEGPLSVQITARFVPTRSVSGKKRLAMLSGQIMPTKKPDLDNIVKCLDSLNKIAFADDCQIVSIQASKVYADTAGVDVSIYPTPGPAETRAAA